MDVRLVIQCIGEGEEIVGVEEVIAIQVVGDEWNEAFSGACIHGGRGHNNFGYRNKKQSSKVIGISLVLRYQPYFI